MIDNDGSFSFSNIIWISNNIKESAGIYPNPASDMITLSIGSDKLLNTTAGIYSEDGRLVQSIKINHLQQVVNIANLPAGLYLIKFENTNSLRAVKE